MDRQNDESSKKPLHYAESIDSLEQLARSAMRNSIKTRNLNMLTKLEKSIYDRLSKEHFDDELAFIYCIRHQHIIQKMKLLDEQFVKNRYKSECGIVNARVEQLRASLNTRYAELASVMVIDPVKKDSPFPPEAKVLFMNSFISPKELYDAMKTFNDLLIVDIRSEEEFLEAKIKYANLISIPNNLISKGLSAHKLGEILPPAAREVWEQRNKFRAIVIVDYTIKNPNCDEEPFAILRSILVNWDINRSYNEHPVVLEGGFQEFAEMYPTEVENGYLYIRMKYLDLNEIMQLVNSVRILVEQSSESGNGSSQDSTTTIKCIDLDEPNANTSGNSSPVLRPKGPRTPMPDDDDDFGTDNGSRPFSPVDDPFDSNDQKADLNDDINNMKLAIQKHLNVQVDEIRKFKPTYPPHFDRTNKPVARVDNVHDSNRIYGLTGIKNIKNNCFMSAILQCFRVLPLVKAFFISKMCRDMIAEKNVVILDEVSYMINALWNSSGRSLNPNSFRMRMIQFCPDYKRGEHEDALEFFSIMLNKLESDTLCYHPRHPYLNARERAVMEMKGNLWSIFTDFFYYVLRMDRICPNCKHRVISYECENTIMLPVPEHRNSSLYELLGDYIKDTVLSDYKCDNCKKVVNAIINKKIKTYPKALVISLKRYHQTPTGCVKSNVKISFPKSQLQVFKANYNLYAILCHKGTLNAGHYYAYCKISNVWYEMNDDLVTNVDIRSDSNIYSEACAFFYQRMPRYNNHEEEEEEEEEEDDD